MVTDYMEETKAGGQGSGMETAAWQGKWKCVDVVGLLVAVNTFCLRMTSSYV